MKKTAIKLKMIPFSSENRKVLKDIEVTYCILLEIGKLNLKGQMSNIYRDLMASHVIEDTCVC